ncbi:MAG: sporulation protein YabP [Acutalibacteraceae bacterium]|nr:sporulation protein YabP [Clostridia bacterium]MEE0980215.1 sporulation protein YabP [Acutalibacteraceae bacterium]
MPENTMHDLVIESRKKVTMTGIVDVESFDEETIVAESECGEIFIKGSLLKISRLSVESGDMIVEGNIDAVSYSEGKAKGGFFSKVFR